MFLNFQTQADIQREIRSALCEIRRPATAMEVVAAIWCKCAVDGNRTGVALTVNQELHRMAREGAVEIVVDGSITFGCDPRLTYYRVNVLDRLANV